MTKGRKDKEGAFRETESDRSLQMSQINSLLFTI